MGTRKAHEQHIRSITQNSSGTYSVSVPIALMRDLNWRKGQKVTFIRSGKRLIIEDWSA